MSEKKNILEGLLATAKSRTPPNEFHLYHLRTVTNYIRYFDKLENPEKEKVFDLLHDYLSLIEEKWGPEREESLDLFRKFISPLIVCYEHLGFTTYIGIWILLIWLLIIETGLYFLTYNVIILILATIPFAFYYRFMKIKMSNGKVHGFKF